MDKPINTKELVMKELNKKYPKQKPSGYEFSKQSEPKKKKKTMRMIDKLTPVDGNWKDNPLLPILPKKKKKPLKRLIKKQKEITTGTGEF